MAPVAEVMATIRRAATKVLGASHPDLEDAIQEGLLGFLTAWGAFRAECHPAGYAGRIATREAIRMLRRTQAYGRKLERFSRSTSPADEGSADVPDRLERARLVQLLLGRLPPAQREAIVSRAVDELTLEEIAARSGAPANTIRSRVRLAKATLRAYVNACSDSSVAGSSSDTWTSATRGMERTTG